MKFRVGQAEKEIEKSISYQSFPDELYKEGFHNMIKEFGKKINFSETPTSKETFLSDAHTYKFTSMYRYSLLYANALKDLGEDVPLSPFNNNT
jgi:competence transcription factor ComK